MKTIKLNESQMALLERMIIEGNGEGAPDFENGDIKEYGDTTENGTTSVVQDDEGNPKYGKMPFADKISHTYCPQNYWANTMNAGIQRPAI